MAYITCKDAAFAYEGETVVGNLNFSVHPGDYLCVVGENGSGKTTVLNGILRLKRPQSGSIEFGEGLTQAGIGYLPQQRAAQKDFPASVSEVILSGRLARRGLRPFYTRADKDAAETNARRLGIHDLYRKCYRELSGGQQQRVLLARALCAAKKLLLLDEPAAGLDPVITQELYAIMEAINKETGMAVVMVSHDIHSAVKYAGLILHLKNTQAFFGTTGEYLKSAVGAAFLGTEHPSARIADAP
ncbi:MAG: ATP-binding cassette domain-containing protein [Treponema sp.]|jgi:zinc transport system ATP-binding protein|nr:ATP-binding cassette domain-containing protein [Treponema sp.]